MAGQSIKGYFDNYIVKDVWEYWYHFWNVWKEEEDDFFFFFGKENLSDTFPSLPDLISPAETNFTHTQNRTN